MKKLQENEYYFIRLKNQFFPIKKYNFFISKMRAHTHAAYHSSIQMDYNLDILITMFLYR